MQLLGRGEVDAAHLVEDVAQQIPALHPAIDALEDGGDHLAAVVAVGAGEAPQVGKQAGTAPAVRADSLVAVDKGQQLVAGDALRVGGPVAPAVGRLDGRAERLARERGLVVALRLQVVEELEEHDPGQQRRRSRSPFSPLSLRMISRADLSRLPSACAVVSGAEAAARGLRGIEMSLEFGHGVAERPGAPKSWMMSPTWPWREIGGTLSASGSTNCASPCSAYFSRSSSRTSWASGE